MDLIIPLNFALLAGLSHFKTFHYDQKVDILSLYKLKIDELYTVFELKWTHWTDLS